VGVAHLLRRPVCVRELDRERGFQNPQALAASATPLFTVVSTYVASWVAVLLAFLATFSAFGSILGCSNGGRDCDPWLRALQQPVSAPAAPYRYLREAGCERIWTDTASGRLARRCQWDACLDHLRRGDELVVTRLSRMAGSVRQLTEIAALLAERGIDLVVLKQGIDTTTPAGRFTFHVLAAMDEMLADLISEAPARAWNRPGPRGMVGGRNPKLTARQAEVTRGMHDETGADGRRKYTVAEIADTSNHPPTAASPATARGRLHRRAAS
jgi:DNA invertase Pin-like site-specific DNA recombinase